MKQSRRAILLAMLIVFALIPNLAAGRLLKNLSVFG
jgi:hypothetical protein